MSDAQPGLMTIFREALERADPADRAAYLDRACGDDAALRQRVEALLESHAGAGRSLEAEPVNPLETAAQPGPGETHTYIGQELESASCAPDWAATGSSDDPDRTGPSTPVPNRSDRFAGGDRIGTVIAGRYTLVEVIGEGGMGSVYLATQTAPVKRQVALKLIKLGMDSRAVLARFDAERQALALMDHPNIARIYDGGVTPAGQPFFVMELVKGVPLSEYSDAHRLTVAARLQLFVQVCEAVQHAHQKGIIHRDLKPGNVLVTEVDGRPTPKVIDFGVAKATEQKLTDQSFSDTGAIVGTPAYMSPEQADPTSMDIDTRADVYALGVMLYELLTGSPPLDSKQFKRGAVLEMLRMVREVDPPRPSTRLSTADALPNIAANRNIEPARLAKLLQGELDWVVMKALEKDRSRRYETANGFARDILRYLADEVVEARPPSRGYRLMKFVKRNKAQVISGCLVALALVGGVVGTTIGMARARQANRELADRNADLEAERAKVEQRFEMARKSIATFHTVITDEKVLENDAFKALRKKLLTEAAGFYRELETLLSAEADAKSRKTLAAGLFQLADLTEKIGDQAEALAVYRRTLAIQRELAAAPGADVETRLNPARTLWLIGRALAATGDPAVAMRAFEESRDLATTLEAQAPTANVRQTLTRSHIGIGVLLSETGNLADALTSLQKARDFGQKLADADPADAEYQSDLAASLVNIGEILWRTGKPADALASHEKARDIREKLALANPNIIQIQSDLAASHNNVGVVLAQTGRPADALASFEKARDIQQSLADDNPAVSSYQTDLAASHGNIGLLQTQTGNLADALTSQLKARDVRQKLADSNPTVSAFQSDVAASHHSIGYLLSWMGQPADALASHEQARDIQQKLANDQPAYTQFQRELAASHNSIGFLQSAMGKPVDALASHKQARDIGQKLVDANPADTDFQSDLALGHNCIGIVLSVTGKPVDALASHEQARDIYQKLADTNPTILSYRSGLASSHNSIGHLHAKMGRFAEAFASLDDGLAIREELVAADAQNTQFTNHLGYSHANRGWTRVRAGQPDGAAADLRRAIELWANDPAPNNETLFEMARALALLCKLGTDPKSGVTEEESKGFADQAVAALAEAIQAGSSNLTELKEPDFDVLRDRGDFQKLVAGLEAKPTTQAEVAPSPPEK